MRGAETQGCPELQGGSLDQVCRYDARRVLGSNCSGVASSPASCAALVRSRNFLRVLSAN